MAVDPALDIDHEFPATRLGLHRGDPLGGFVLVELDPDARRRRDDPGDRLVLGDLRRHPMPSFRRVDGV